MAVELTPKTSAATQGLSNVVANAVKYTLQALTMALGWAYPLLNNCQKSLVTPHT